MPSSIHELIRSLHEQAAIMERARSAVFEEHWHELRRSADAVSRELDRYHASKRRESGGDLIVDDMTRASSAPSELASRMSGSGE